MDLRRKTTQFLITTYVYLLRSFLTAELGTHNQNLHRTTDTDSQQPISEQLTSSKEKQPTISNMSIDDTQQLATNNSERGRQSSTETSQPTPQINSQQQG
jgi:hypothetical protein